MKSNTKSLLIVKNASYQYSDAEEGEYALRDVSFEFEKGKVYAIRGRSGTGKTTLLSLISGLERCTEGDIIFNGKNLRDINLDYYRSHDIGIVFQSYNLLPFMTASENIILSMDASGSKVADKKARALELMKSVGLKESYANRKVLRLSGGEQQRVAIARSLSYNPKMIVADEPTGNLDADNARKAMELLSNKLNEMHGSSAIIVSHDMRLSMDFADVIIKIKKCVAEKNDSHDDNTFFGLITDQCVYMPTDAERSAWTNGNESYKDIDFEQFLKKG